MYPNLFSEDICLIEPNQWNYMPRLNSTALYSPGMMSMCSMNIDILSFIKILLNQFYHAVSILQGALEQKSDETEIRGNQESRKILSLPSSMDKTKTTTIYKTTISENKLKTCRKDYWQFGYKEKATPRQIRGTKIWLSHTI